MNTTTHNNMASTTTAGTTGPPMAGTMNSGPPNSGPMNNGPMNGGTVNSSAANSTTTGPTSHTIPTSKQTTNPIKNAFAKVHGAGEVLRGTVNGAVEGVFNESGAKTREEGVTSAGIDEMETGRFSHAAKAREGVVPGSGIPGGRRV